MPPEINPTLWAFLAQIIITIAVILRNIAREKDLKGRIKILETQREVNTSETKDKIALDKAKAISFVESKSLENQSALIGVTGNLADAVLAQSSDLKIISGKVSAISSDTADFIKSLEDIRQSIRELATNLGSVMNNRTNELSSRMDQIAAKSAREHADLLQEIRELMHDIEGLPTSMRKEVHMEISSIMSDANRSYMPPPPAKVEIAVVGTTGKLDTPIP